MNIGQEGVGKFGVAVDGQGHETCRGWVVAHSVAPQVLIETVDGQRHWVREDMARLATEDEIRALLVDAYHWRHAQEWDPAKDLAAMFPAPPATGPGGGS